MIATVALVVLLAQVVPAATAAASPIATPVTTVATPMPTAPPPDAAVIRTSGSTNTAPYEIVVVPSGDATIVQSRSETHVRLASPQTRWLFYRLARAAPLDTFPAGHCMKSASFGTSTTLDWNGHHSPDLSCPGGDPALRELARIADVIVKQLGVRTQRPVRRMPL